MAHSRSADLALCNRLLAALPPDDLARLLPQLEPVEVEQRHILQAPDQPLTTVYFHVSGWTSMLAQLADGRSAEVGLIGSEGMVGLPLLLGSDSSSTEAMVQTTLWSIPSRDQDADTVHGTQKPVECMRRPIENNSSPGQTVYEPFSGSGTTLIAAEMTGRACHAVELSPAYADVAVLRWQAFTGLVARLEASGRTFAEVRAERCPATAEEA
ncbi:MAG TPA: DNA methyltransferase [Roseomonas sp.]|jgi:hypothetical protein